MVGWHHQLSGHKFVKTLGDSERSLDWEDPLEEGTATHSSILAWRIPMDRGAWRATVYENRVRHD